MIGTAIATGLGVASSIAGAVLGAREARRQKSELEARERRNENWYNKNFNEDPLQRLGAQAAWTRANEAVKAHRRASAGRAAVMGSTPEQTQADAAQGLNMLGETAGNIAAGADARRDNIEQQYMARQDSFDAQRAQIRQQSAQNIAGAVQGANKAFSGLVGAFDGGQSNSAAQAPQGVTVTEKKEE